MRLASANIKGTPAMPQEHVEHDVQGVASRADVVIWQEIGKRRYKRAVRQLHGFEHAHLDTEVPISWRSDQYELVAGKKVRAHRGRPMTSPARFVTWVILRDRATGALFAVVNAHYVSGAWNKKRKLFKKWRQRKWVGHYRIHANVIRSLAAAGLTVLGGGDFNKVKVQKFHPDLAWIFSNGIDYLFAVEGETEVRLDGKRRLRGHHECRPGHFRGFHTDHSPRWANLLLH